jgi:hypothetical protein
VKYAELLRMLSEAIARGYVEQIPVTKPNRFTPNEAWYRDKETGQIYSLTPPDERGGWWAEVDLEALMGSPPTENIQ